VLARRIIALSPDKPFARQLVTALAAAGGAVELHATVEDAVQAGLDAALVVLHLDGELSAAAAELVPQLTGDTHVIAILPRAGLVAVVDTMLCSDRVVGTLVAEQPFDAAALTAFASRVLAGDIFGLEKLLPWGVLVHSELVGDYHEKSRCIAQVGAFADAMGVRRKFREAIDQCLDEMLMNALYDAPIDEQGRSIFGEIPIKTRMGLRLEQRVIVQYACDGKRFVVSVRDMFGTLERATVLRYLHKCLHAEHQIDRKAGGAGLGLYLIANTASVVLFHVLPGIATEAICVFELEHPRRLEQLGLFTEKIDAAGRLAGGPSRRLPAGTSHPVERRAPAPSAPPHGIIALLSVVLAAVLALIAIEAWPRIFGP
jgi:hypothetical protein